MRVPFVDLSAQYRAHQAELDGAIAGVIQASAFIGGAQNLRFEQAFARYCGAGHCVGVGNGTDALYLALRALGVGPGDEVITAANSFIATSEAITLSGAQVVFVDCDPETYTLDVTRLEAAITPRTKAIIPVHLYGRIADMPAIMALARHHGLRVVEDAAQAHGAELAGQRAGAWGDAGCFSFYPGKNLGAYGDGGAVVTGSEPTARMVRMLANHGRISKYDHEFEGVNSRLDGLQAAILEVKLRHLEDWTERRRAAARLYAEGLRGSGLPIPLEPTDGRCVWHLFVTRVAERDRVQAALKAAGIDTGAHYPIALPNLTAYRHLGHRPEDFPVASRYQSQLLSLPMFPEITPDQIAHVCATLRSVAAPGGTP